MTEQQRRQEERTKRQDAWEKKQASMTEEEKLFAATAEEAEKALERKKQKQKNMETTAWDMTEEKLTHRTQKRHEKELDGWGVVDAARDVADATLDPLAYGTAETYQPSEERVDALVGSLADIEQKRNKFSRRRQHYEEDEITYINERNRVFNRKVARTFDKYTSEIKNNLERGTAL